MSSSKNCFEHSKSRLTNVRKQLLLISRYFTTIPGGWPAGAGYSKNTTNSAQLRRAGAWAELGNNCWSRNDKKKKFTEIKRNPYF